MKAEESVNSNGQSGIISPLAAHTRCRDSAG
jgi:hypothetical protein